MVDAIIDIDRREKYRLIAVMHDGTVVEKDHTPTQHESDSPLHWLPAYRTVQLADIVICVNLRTGVTEVVKNRWGQTGTVVCPRTSW